MAYNTGNPIGSTDPRDLSDNSQDLDQAMNSTASNWTDRLGNTRKTFRAAENAAQAVEDSAATHIAEIEQNAADVDSTATNAITTLIPADVQRVTDDANTAINTEIPAEVQRVVDDANVAINTEIPNSVSSVDSAAAAGISAINSDVSAVDDATSSSLTQIAEDVAVVNSAASAGTDSINTDVSEVDAAAESAITTLIPGQVSSVENAATAGINSISTEVDSVNSAATNAINVSIPAEIDRIEPAATEALNNLLVAGGRIFDSEEQGRAVVLDGQYYFAVSTNQNASKTLWKKLSSVESEFIANDPSVEFVEFVSSQHIQNQPQIICLPNVDYYLNAPVETKADYSLNLISATSKTGAVASVLKDNTTLTLYPFRNFNDEQTLTEVDSNGGIFNEATLRSFFGQYAPYPFRNFNDDSLIKQVDINNNVVGLPPPEEPVVYDWPGRMLVQLDGEAQSLSIVWPHGDDKLLRINYQPNGVNDLFNWQRTEIANGIDPTSAVWSVIQESNSDAWPPLIFSAVNNGDGGEPIYTGGNHSSDGGVGGESTAYTSEIQFEVGGKRMLPGESFEGYADQVRVYWRNEIMAYNTISIPRYALYQEIEALFSPGDVSAFVSVTAYEPISMIRDNGPQMFSDGYDSFHYYDGQQQKRLPIPQDGSTNTSGVFATYPAWACVFADSANGYHGAWLDREFEAGDGRYIGGSEGAFRKGSGAKFYSSVVGSMPDGVSLNAGESYQWHGGYFWSPESSSSGNVDSSFTYHSRRRARLGYAFTEAGAGAVFLPTFASGCEVEAIGVDGVKGIPLNANGYQTENSLILG